MSVFDKHRDTLEHHETMMGSARGRLAVALDLLTDSLALVGQHGVYCRSERFPGKPKMDIALVLEQLDDAKQLVQSAMEELQERLTNVEDVRLTFVVRRFVVLQTSFFELTASACDWPSSGVTLVTPILPPRHDDQPEHAGHAEQRAERERHACAATSRR